MTTSDTATRAGISRTTLRAVEAGEPSATMGSYLRVMSALNVVNGLALIASEAERGASRGGADSVVVRATDAKHEVQDLQSLVLHQAAVRLVKQRPELLQQAIETLEKWRQAKASHSKHLWDEWAVILHRRNWRRALSHSQRSTELRQASPLVTVLPKDVRQSILDEVKEIKRGVRLPLS